MTANNEKPQPCQCEYCLGQKGNEVTWDEEKQELRRKEPN